MGLAVQVEREFCRHVVDQRSRDVDVILVDPAQNQQASCMIEGLEDDFVLRSAGVLRGASVLVACGGVEASEEFVGVVRLGVKLEREEIRSSSIIIRREVSEESQDAQ